MTDSPTENTDVKCEWFQWFAMPGCARCGGSPGVHRGLEWLHPGAGPFGGPEDNILVEWADYGPGRYLNVPLLTAHMPEGMLEALQGGPLVPLGWRL